jgi:predicted nucleic acid-binding protein
MARHVLADTGPLYAYALTKDALHHRAKTELSQLRTSGYTLLIPQPALLETHKLLLRRTHAGFATRFLRALAHGTDRINPRSAHYDAAITLAERYPDQDLSLYDTLLAVLSAEFLVAIWTFDHHFDILGASVWRNSA